MDSSCNELNGNRLALILAAFSIVASSGCQRSLYDWGTYEASVFRMYSSHEDFSAASEVDQLQGEVDKTRARSRNVPPGKTAHLGYLYLMTGDSDRARGCFEVEKAEYPEGAQFMDFLLTRVQ